jgi:hypothetical protein
MLDAFEAEAALYRLRCVYCTPAQVSAHAEMVASPSPREVRQHPEFRARHVLPYCLATCPDASRARHLARFNLAIDFTTRWQRFQVIHGLEIQPELGC